MLEKNSEVNKAGRFLANTLHEIRTPIQTIIGTIELLQDTKLDGEQSEYVRQIQFSAEVLLDLANNILDFTKVQSDEFKLETIPFDIAKVAEQVVDVISIEAFNKGVEVVTDISTDVPPFVVGDPVRVQQIMLNLIKNAVKFTNEGYIHIELLKIENKIKFQITDSGIGISEDKQKYLFTDYFQADISTYRKFGGTGLGLSIVKNLVSKMKGQIGVKSNPFGGTIFWVTLPLKEPEVEFQPLDGKTPTFAPMRILVVDNSALAVKSLRQKLLPFGITDVESAETPKEALNRIDFAQKISKPFSIVFINLLLSSVDGWHLASEIKNRPEYCDKLKLYLLVPEGQMRGEAKMKLLDWFDGYLYKPIKRDKLASLLSGATKNNGHGLGKGNEEIDVKLQAEPKSVITDLVAKGLKILVAEDHTVNRKLIQSFLRSFGADVLLAEDGEQAVRVVQENKDISLIFMDIFMPKKSGVEATAEIREKGYKGIVIACTANNDSNDFADYMKIGINDILVKPFKKSAIKSAIEKWNAVIQIPSATKISTLEVVPESQKEESDCWDLDDFLETVDGDKSFGKSLIVDFVKQTEKLLKEIETNLTNTLDSEQIHKLAHTIKGSAAAVSAKNIFKEARDLDEAAKNTKNLQDTARLNPAKLQEEFVSFKRTVAKIIKDWQ